MIRIALDVMGGDNAPDINIDGAYDALGSNKELNVTMVGPMEMIRDRTSGWDKDRLSRMSIADARTVISPNEHPVQSIKKKKDSSIVVGTRLVKSGEADAFISAGSSGAILAAGQLIIGRMKGVHRPPLASMIPTARGVSLFMDCGANVDARAEWLVQYAVMGTIYMDKVMHIPDASVGLVNLGTEEEKGNALVKAAHPMLRETKGINYHGFVESRDVIYGETDIVITDAFTGNAIIKTYEGVAGFLIDTIKDIFKSGVLTRLAALLVMKPLRQRLKDFDVSKCGGAVLLGLNGIIIKCHGNAKRADISGAIAKAYDFASEDVNALIRSAVQSMQDGVNEG